MPTTGYRIVFGDPRDQEAGSCDTWSWLLAGGAKAVDASAYGEDFTKFGVMP
jgi:hypothetical protein